VQVELFDSPHDVARFILELIVALTLLVSLASSTFTAIAERRLAPDQRRTKEISDITGSWKLLESLSSALVLVLLVTWWLHAFTFTRRLSMNTMYGVYADLDARLHKLRYADAHGTGLQAAADGMAKVGLRSCHSMLLSICSAPWQ
jgi:hypothetical protein